MLELANAANSHKELFDNMARTFLLQMDGRPRDSSLSELWEAQGGVLTAEAQQFLPNDGIRSKYIGVSPDFPAGQPGQIRHFVAALISASQPGGTTAMMSRELDTSGLIPKRAMDVDSVADRPLMD